MYQQPASPGNNNDANLRFLIDQRAARAALPSNFSFFSDYDDSPSIYSHAAFPPNSHHNEIHTLGSPLSPSRPYLVSDKERLNDPSLSSLDLDDDLRSSLVLSTSNDELQPQNDNSGEEDDLASRISMFGPKMRIHSPAPWELEDSPIIEETEPSSSYLSAARNGVKKLGFSSASPRSSNPSSRPSTDSARSWHKKSFENFSSGSSQSCGSATHTQASMLSTSLALAPPTAPYSLLNKLSISRYRPQTPVASSTPSSTHSISSGNPYAGHSHANQLHYASLYQTSSDHGSNSGYSPRSSNAWLTQDYDENEETKGHPYANPEAASYYQHETHPASSQIEIASPHYQVVGVSRSNSSLTITESSTVSSTATKVSPDTPVTGSYQKHTTLLHGKEISSPLNIGSPLELNPHHSTLGRPERRLSPTFNLISLEQAQQQASRARSATFEGGAPAFSFSNSSSTTLSFPELHQDITRLSHASPSSSSHTRQRSRSISTGVRARTVLSNSKSTSGSKMDRRDSESSSTSSGLPPGKSLKHKKSGFMRIFNGREKDKDGREMPPPVPSLSETFVATVQQSQPLPSFPKSTAVTGRRVPVPSLDPPISKTLNPTIQSQEISEGVTSIFMSPKRTPPLSINTTRSQNSLNPVTNSITRLSTGPVSEPNSASTKDGPWHNTGLPPQSAPANVTEFGALSGSQIPSLSLRPVSTTFSAQFGDHFMAKPALTPALEEDGETISPTSCPSPATPGVFTRASAMNRSEKVLPIPSDQDQSSIIQALQDQIVSAKLAWQRQIWELEGQVRDLKAEVEEARLQLVNSNKEFCQACGRGPPSPLRAQISSGSTSHPNSVNNRPRARTGLSHRFVNS